MAPAAKKRKTQVERYHCTSCETDRTSRQFPEYNPTVDCDHLINTCSACLKEWIAVQLRSGSFRFIKCPECDKEMQNSDVKLATSKTAYQVYDERERRHRQDNTPGWRWCLSPTCRAGQVHKKKVATPKKGAGRSVRGGKRAAKSVKEEPGPDICTCQECGFKACVACDRPWHEGETCVEYRARVKDRVVEEDKSLRAIEKKTKKCPTCHRSIERAGGCPSMYCTQCNTPFCWNCLSTFASGHCACYVPPPQQPTIG